MIRRVGLLLLLAAFVVMVPRGSVAAPPTEEVQAPSDDGSSLAGDADLIEGEGEAKKGKRKLRSHVDLAAARFSLYVQEGTGFQSRAGPSEFVAGSQEMFVYQWAGFVGIDSGPKLRNDVYIALDVVTAASADALDVYSAASRVTEAGDIIATTTYSPTPDDHVVFRYGPHLEEHWWGGRFGVGYNRDLANDNIILGASVNGIIDYFDLLDIDGTDTGEVFRYTLNANANYSQVLSPTTLAALNYGFTYQAGVLETTYNSIPLDPDADRGEEPIDTDVKGRIQEVFPDRRLRHAFSGTLLQHIPKTRSTVRADYRYYFDDFSLQAHSAAGSFFQWIRDDLYVRANYRFHYQSGVDFFTTSIRPTSFDLGSPVTADSDLGGFTAHEIGAKLVVYLRPPNSAKGGPQSLDLGYRRYFRSNDLRVDVISIGYQGQF